MAARSKWLVVLRGEKLCQRQPRPLAAGKGADVLLPTVAVQTDAEQRGFQAVPPGVAAGNLEFVLDVLIAFEETVQLVPKDVGHLVLDLALFVGQIMQRGEGQLGLIDYGVGRIEHWVLREMTDANPLGDGG